MLSITKKGELFIFGEGVLWAFFPIVTILSYSLLPPMVALAWSTLVAALFFGCVMLVKGGQKELLNPKIYRYIFFIAFFIGWLFYGLFFIGLKFTTAGNAAIIAQMELFFSFLLFNVWKKEFFSPVYALGAVMMLLGVLVLLFPKQGLSFHGGDFLVLVASACAPLGNYYQQKARKLVSSETILFLRSLLTFPFFFLLVFLFKSGAGGAELAKSFWLILFNGILILGLSKIFWLEGIHRISVTKATALGAATPAFTLVLAYFILHQKPIVWQLLALIPMFFGVLLLTKSVRPKEIAV